MYNYLHLLAKCLYIQYIQCLCQSRLSTEVYALFLVAWLNEVEVKVTLRLAVSQSVSLRVEPPLGLMTRYLLLFDSFCLDFLGASSLTRGRVSLLCMLLAFASAVFLGSESLGTRNHILLSQIWDFLFRRGGVFEPAPHRLFSPSLSLGYSGNLVI
jgi:hypothetical protein